MSFFWKNEKSLIKLINEKQHLWSEKKGGREGAKGKTEEKASKIEKEKQKGKKELKSDLQNVFYK